MVKSILKHIAKTNSLQHFSSKNISKWQYLQGSTFQNELSGPYQTLNTLDVAKGGKVGML